MADIVDVIKAQHREFERLLDLAAKEEGDVREILRQFGELLKPHSDAEEDFVYPSISELAKEEDDEVKDGAVEHHHMQALFEELAAEDPDAAGFDGKLAALTGELKHHMDEEEEELLPVLSKKASAQDRSELADRFTKVTNWSGGGTSS